MLSELINSFAEKLAVAVEHETCAVTLIDAHSGEIIVAHARGAHAGAIQSRRHHRRRMGTWLRAH